MSFVRFEIWLTHISFITAYHIEPYQIALCQTNFLSNWWGKKYQYNCLKMILSSFVQFGIWLTHIPFITADHNEPYRIALCETNFLSDWWGKKYQHGCILMLSSFVRLDIISLTDRGHIRIMMIKTLTILLNGSECGVDVHITEEERKAAHVRLHSLKRRSGTFIFNAFARRAHGSIDGGGWDENETVLMYIDVNVADDMVQYCHEDGLS